MGLTRRDSHKVAVFMLTFFSYAFFHANRKAFSNVKTSTGRVWTPSFQENDTDVVDTDLKPTHLWNSHRLFDTEDEVEKFQGLLDTIFMLAYAAGLYLNGYIGDRVDMRILLTFGMAGTSVMVFIFGFLCEWLQFYNKYFYAIIWILNGLLQSTGWPVVVACMGNWFGQSSRGFLLGLWSSCASVGNIIGALLASSVLTYGYQYCFLMTCSVLLSASGMVFIGLIPTPMEAGFNEVCCSVEGKHIQQKREQYSVNNDGEDQVHSDKSVEYKNGDIYTISIITFGTQKVEIVQEKTPDPLLGATNSHTQMPDDADIVLDQGEADDKPKSMSFGKVCLLPGVIPYSLAYAFLKLVNYSFFFWLPFYLNNQYHWKESTADQLSTAYDIAGIVGGTIVGFASDRLGKRTILIVPMLILSIPSLFAYGQSPADMTINTVLMSLIGFLIGGASNLISAAVSADLGCQKALQGNDKALSTVTGIVDGTGSFGAALGQIAVPYLQTGLGWDSVFYLFMICMFMTAVCLTPLFIKEVRSLRCPCSPTRDLAVEQPSPVTTNGDL